MIRPTPTVLLADDEKLIRKLLRLALERRGYQVLEAADGQRALALSRKHDGPIDLLLAGVRLAKMDGIALADAVEAEREGVKVVLMSTEAHRPGPRRIVQKPFAVWALLNELDTELERKPAGRENPVERSRARNGF